jgi:uncharacterized protein (DUF58 family)
MKAGGAFRPSASLLDPAFVTELEALRRLVRPRARSGRTGAHGAIRRGAGVEFEEHRGYAPGDDVARLDWLAFARAGQPMLKVARADEDVVVRILLDASASLGVGEPSKLEMARRVAAAVGYLALASSERAQLVVAGGGSTPLSVTAPRRGRAALGALLAELSAVKPTGQGDLASALGRVLTTAGRPGVLVVLSDFLDPGPVLEALGRARHARHDVALVQVLTPEELSPTPGGDVALQDAETGETVDLTLDAATLAAYEARLGELCAALRGFARTAAGTYVRARTDEELGQIVRRVVARAIE